MTSSVQAPPPAEHPAAGGGAARVELTERQRVALTAMACGLSHAAAGRQLGPSGRTLRRALIEAVDALGARSVMHAVALAVDAGLLDMRHIRERTPPRWPVAPVAPVAPRSAAARTGDPSPAQTAAARENGRASREQAIARKATRLAMAVPLFEQDMPVHEIATRLGVTTVTVYTYRREWLAGRVGERGG